ncbi:Oxidoreductase FAD/NAD(P)-binding domain protein [Candidatus Methylobacter favarea]|uniref:Oxidoreductase FAD/NAD(P)-binding domain protein n=1 Tax=Candidatus Methylobacter favarea TaxID=2707345 RepID=A0A8S0WLC1_9GAMM|nr:pyridine nucleotide-disulfide oxidoreductase [Candidatus Methylobacter favarea]CAA9892520.1 Oxidoreductase FAD/NAD(P)-binding domain protein [Candidatus Methylobacter favarea]
MAQNNLALGIPGFNYSDLYDAARLNDLLEVFDASVKKHDVELYNKFAAYRQNQGTGLEPEAISDLLVKMGPYVGQFVARLFNVSGQHQAQSLKIKDEFDSVFTYKNEVLAKLNLVFKDQDISEWDINAIQSRFELLIEAGFPEANQDNDPERRVARAGAFIGLLSTHYRLVAKGKESHYQDADQAAEDLRSKLAAHKQAAAEFSEIIAVKEPAEFINSLKDIVQRWSFVALNDNKLTSEWLSFKFPEKRDFEDLVEHDTIDRGDYTAWMGEQEHRRRRDGFKLTDPRFNQRQVLSEVDHCIYCHERDTDSCSKGMRNKKTNTFKVDPLGVTTTGCPLDEKISEMHLVKRNGDNIGALAIIIIDNPMCPGTGHRICNDCMKGCIYQKTDPVNIPQIETNVLTEVLFMPYGFEIYSLLTRWNPLNVKRPVMLPYNGKNALVVGLGPAGYTMSHYLLNEGFGVAGIDALKLEPLPIALTGDSENPPTPIIDFSELYEQLDQRILAGFGGVAEYGITVRWDKNFLKVIYLTLLRRETFRAYGGVRFGGTITIEDAWKMGFDHICIASGAGKPTIIDLKNNLIRGIRKASDFLMALQLTGAAKAPSLANLQVRLPAGVIGGGLTAIDTSTELMAYYPVQVEKILNRYEVLVDIYGEQTVRSRYDKEETLILDEFLSHGQAIRGERQRARTAGEQPNFQPLLETWGGVTLFYRKGMKEAPAYRQNHEEIAEALEEGIALAEGMSPQSALADEYGHLNAVEFEKLVFENGKWTNSGQLVNVPLRSLYIAAGTSPNTIYQSEYPDTFKMDRHFFQRYEPEWVDGELELVAMHDETAPKLGKPAPLTSYHKDGKFISFYGDNHPVYAGNVVKAMASAKNGYPYVVKLFEQELAKLNPAQQPERNAALKKLFAALDEAFTATIVAINRLTPTIIEVVVKAPLAAEKFHPGQFYRVQNFEALAPVEEGTVLTAEGLALTGAEVDKEKGTISLIALEMGSSSRLCATWKTGDPLVIMGVTGTPTEIPTGQTVLLIGGGLGNAVLFSIGKALRAAGNRVIYFAGYKYRQDVFKIEDIEAASDLIIWSVDKGPGVEAIPTTRPQDKTFVGNILECMTAYAKGELGGQPIPLADVDHLIVIGSDRMMAAVKDARFNVLKPYLKKVQHAIGSINSPMQCMMKGICAQCLCKHVDAETGKEYFVYSCYNQDQELDKVDFKHLNARLRQNTVQEKLSNLWLDYLLEKQQARKSASKILEPQV